MAQKKIYKTNKDYNGSTTTELQYYADRYASMSNKWPFSTMLNDEYCSIHNKWHIITTHNKNWFENKSDIQYKTGITVMKTFFYTEEDKRFIESVLLIFKSFFITFYSYEDCLKEGDDNIYIILKKCNESFNPNVLFDIIMKELSSNLPNFTPSEEDYSSHKILYSKINFDKSDKKKTPTILPTRLSRALNINKSRDINQTELHKMFLYILSVMCKVIETIHRIILSYQVYDINSKYLVNGIHDENGSEPVKTFSTHNFKITDFRINLKPDEILSRSSEADKRRNHMLILNENINAFNKTCNVKTRFIPEINEDMPEIKQLITKFMNAQVIDDNNNRNFNEEELIIINRINENIQKHIQLIKDEDTKERDEKIEREQREKESKRNSSKAKISSTSTKPLENSLKEPLLQI